MSFQLFSFLTLSELEYFVNLMRIMTTINIHSFGVQVMKNTLVSCDSIKQEERKKHSIYSTGRKSWIFCFALLLPQILVNFRNQGQIWNLLVLTYSKHPLHVQFDHILAEIFEFKDTWLESFISMIIDLTERKTIQIWIFFVKSNWLNILDLLMVFLRISLVDNGTFEGKQTNFWNKLFRFLLISSPTNQLSWK